MVNKSDSGGRENYVWFIVVTLLVAALVIGAWWVGNMAISVDELADRHRPRCTRERSGCPFLGASFRRRRRRNHPSVEKQLGYQRQELRQTKEAMQKSALTQEKQTEELRQQTELLKKQVAEQAGESRVTAEAQKRQSREQFLTAAT